MEALGALADGAAAQAALAGLPERYEEWVGRQEAGLGGLSAPRREVAEVLLNDARRAADRIGGGIAQLANPSVLDAFRTMNRAIGAAANRRRPGQTPRWYPFQLAFILLNLPGLVNPQHHDRETVDLLFFPTGGGKTEAYLGLAAFAGDKPGRPRFASPGLVVALLNLNKPRDRSHYEHFATWHACFEAVSVTPFAPGALDRGLAAVAVALARLGHAELNPSTAAVYADAKRGELEGIADALAARAGEQKAGDVRGLVRSLLDDWAGLAHDCRQNATAFGYAALPGVTKPLLREMLDPELSELSERERRFRAPRSLRDVESSVLLRPIGPDGRELGDVA